MWQKMFKHGSGGGGTSFDYSAPTGNHQANATGTSHSVPLTEKPKLIIIGKTLIQGSRISNDVTVYDVVNDNFSYYEIDINGNLLGLVTGNGFPKTINSITDTEININLQTSSYTKRLNVLWW